MENLHNENIIKQGKWWHDNDNDYDDDDDDDDDDD